MKSVFDPNTQNKEIESKIVFALERISQVFRVNLWKENKKYSLSPIQIQILIHVFYQNNERKTVSFLANEFNMSKATISDAVKILEQKKFIAKKINPNDSRSSILVATKKGEKAAEELSQFANVLRDFFIEMNDNDKINFQLYLFDLIKKLQSEGIISMQRMCYTCIHFRNNKNSKSQFYCNLLNEKLRKADLRINCLEHEAA